MLPSSPFPPFPMDYMLSLLSSTSLPLPSSLSRLLSGRPRDLHVRRLTPRRTATTTPSMMIDDESAFLVPLLQAAATEWQGPLRLHLEQHPMERDVATLNLSPILLNALLQLLKCVDVQKRPLTIILERHFLPDSTQLNRILQAAAPSLVRMESNLSHSVEWLSRAHRLQTLVMELDNGSNHIPMRQQQLQGLIALMKDSSFSHLQGLHLDMPSSVIDDRGIYHGATTTNKMEDGELLPLFSSLSVCMARKQSLRSIKLSGDMRAILVIVQGWEEDPPGLDTLEICSFDTIVMVVASTTTDEEMKKFAAEVASVPTHSHDTVHVRLTTVLSMWKAVSTIPQVEISLLRLSLLSSPIAFSDILLNVSPAPRMTHLSLHMGLTTKEVDHLMTHMGRLTPNLQELDLEGNDIDTWEMTSFFSSLKNSGTTATTSSPSTLVPSHLERIYTGHNYLHPHSAHLESMKSYWKHVRD